MRPYSLSDNIVTLYWNKIIEIQLYVILKMIISFTEQLLFINEEILFKTILFPGISTAKINPDFPFCAVHNLENDYHYTK